MFDHKRKFIHLTNIAKTNLKGGTDLEKYTKKKNNKDHKKKTMHLLGKILRKPWKERKKRKFYKLTVSLLATFKKKKNNGFPIRERLNTLYTSSLGIAFFVVSTITC